MNPVRSRDRLPRTEDKANIEVLEYQVIFADHVDRDLLRTG